MIYSRQSLQTLKTMINPAEIISTVGNIPYSCIIDNGSEIRCPCPIHGGDQITGFSWKKTEGLWSCFTKGCGENTEIIRDVYGFIMLKKGVSFAEAATLLADMYGFSLEEGEVRDFSTLYIASKIKKTQAAKIKYKIDRLEKLKNLPGYCKSQEAHSYINSYLQLRGYDKLELLYPFKLYPCLDLNGSLRIGIPSYDEENRLVGVNARRLDGILTYGVKEPKYKMLSGYKKGAVLYNLNNAKYHSHQKGLIVVEGEFSTMRLVTYGIQNVVGIMGNTISSKQLPLIYKHTYHLIFLVEEGQAAIDGVYKSIKNLIPNSMKISIAKLPSGDPDTNTKETITQVLENARTLKNEEITNIKNGIKVI